MFKKNITLSIIFTVILVFAFIFIYGIEDYQMPTPTAEAEPSPAVEEEPVDEAEKFIGVAEGYGGEMEVEVSIKDGEIVYIEVLEHQETDDFAIPAFEDLIEAVMEAQSTDVDMVSGATATSEGFLAAVDDALAQADPEEEVDMPDTETYTATVEAYGGDLTVEVLLTPEEILNIQVTDHEETEDIADPALEETPQDIIAAQSTDVEAVSGATVTSEAIMEAVEIALAEAEWDPDEEVEEPVEEETMIETATVEAYGGDLTVEVELSQQEIFSIEVIEHSETEGIAEPALEETPQDIIAAQSTEVDVVSGATVTSEAIMEAVQKILDDVGFDPTAEPEEPVEEESQKITTSAEGYGGELVVEVEIAAGEIIAIDILEHKETEGFAEPALEEIPEEIIATQSPDVDVVSGVTETSEAIMEAVRKALEEAEAEVTEEEDDGEQVLTGSAEGYGGELVVEVTIGSDGDISSIEIIEHSESEDIGEPAFDKIPQAIIDNQDTDVDVLSGATKTSEAIITAVERALADRDVTVEPEDDVEPDFTISDGTYTGIGSGFYDDIEIEVTVEDGLITEIQVLAHEDVPDNAEPAFDKLIENVIATQSIEKDTISGATYSSEGFLEALADAVN